MSNTATILELAGYEDDCKCPCHKGNSENPDHCDCGSSTVKVPLIRTSDGRTLRKPCTSLACRDPKKWGGVGYVQTGAHKDCNGRGWLPVDEDTAVVSIIDWAMDGCPPKGDSGDLLREITDGLLNTAANTYAAVFAAAKEIVG